MNSGAINTIPLSEPAAAIQSESNHDFENKKSTDINDIGASLLTTCAVSL